jgi:hypothetical protein
MSKKSKNELLLVEHIEPCIMMIRGQRVILDADLAALYGVPTKALNQDVKRNMERFPADFTFKLNADEARILRSQIVTASTCVGYTPINEQVRHQTKTANRFSHRLKGEVMDSKAFIVQD